jgi:hypothetical protein
MARDPQRLHAFWTISPWDRERHGLDRPGGAPPLVLRLFERGVKGGPAAIYRGQHVVAGSDCWTLTVPPEGRHWQVELGFVGRDGRFQVICQSETITTRGEPPTAEAPHGAPVLVGAAAETPAAPGAATPRMEAVWAEALRTAPGSPQGAQPGSPPGIAPQRAAGEQVLEFDLEVRTELVLRGATDPGARVTVRGEPVSLDPDGSFTLSMDLPEGYHQIPVQATSADGDEERSVTVVVLRMTQ